MKKLLVLSSLLLIIGMVLGCVGCGTKKALNTNPSFLKYGVLQGKIMDALTGAAIGGKDLKVYLIEGKTNRKPDKLITDTKNPLVGEYAFDSVPVNIIAKEITFKVVIIKDGYQRFEANVSIEANFTGGADNITDEVFNKIGNIYLYPLGTSASDVTVYVTSPQNKPIPNATVLLQQDVTNNKAISYIGDRLAAAAGLYPSLTNTTDSTGKATFSGADLTLGGSYRVVVEALTFEGQALATPTATSAAFITGVDPTTRVVNMAAIGNWLFATSASNSVQGTITADGSLTITFNQPIILSTMSFTANMTGGGTPSPQTVTGELSNSNTTLTLRPKITTAPKGATIIYTFSGTIFLQNSQLPTYTLFTGNQSDVENITTGYAVSGEVQMTSN